VNPENDADRANAAGISVLYRDDVLVIADKPGGMLVHRSRESSDRVFLLQELRNQLGQHLYPVHRIDRAASGAIAFALSSDAARAVQAALGRDDARKEYLVLVRGSAPAAGEIDRPLTGENGEPQAARTSFERLAELSRCSLLRVRIHTGRRHQIRRHLAHLRHQVIGDTSYGKGGINRFLRQGFGLPRLFLHAAALGFEHPFAGGRLEVRAPLAEDLRSFLLRLPDVDPALVARL
jgi:tRNA pseudouridine65 synthase